MIESRRDDRGARTFQSSLRDSRALNGHPNVKTLGYFRISSGVRNCSDIALTLVIRIMVRSGFLLSSRGLFFEFLDDLHDTVAANYRVVHDKLESGSEFEDHGFCDQALDTLPVPSEQIDTALLLFGRTPNADKNDSRMQIPRNVNVVDCDQAGFAHLEFAAN